MYLTLKFLHVFLTIIAVGFTATFGLIMARAAKGGPDGREVKFALETLRLMGIIAHVCFFLILVTGVGMVQVAGFPWYGWIKWSIAIFTFNFVIGLFVLAPSVSKRLMILSARGMADPEFIALSKRGAALGGVLSLLTLVILWLMIAKPF